MGVARPGDSPAGSTQLDGDAGAWWLLGAIDVDVDDLALMPHDDDRAVATILQKLHKRGQLVRGEGPGDPGRAGEAIECIDAVSSL